MPILLIWRLRAKWWRHQKWILIEGVAAEAGLHYQPLPPTHPHTTHSQQALRQRATSGLRKTPAGAQLAILVVIFLFFHYGFVSSGCNRRAINQHYFHISAPAEDAKMARRRRRRPQFFRRAADGQSAPATVPARRGNVIDRAVMFVDRVGPRRLDSPAGMQFPWSRRRRPVKEYLDVCGRRPPKSTGTSRSYSYLMCRCLLSRHVTGARMNDRRSSLLM